MSNLSNRCERPDSAGADPRNQQQRSESPLAVIGGRSACGFALATRAGNTDYTLSCPCRRSYPAALPPVPVARDDETKSRFSRKPAVFR